MSGSGGDRSCAGGVGARGHASPSRDDTARRGPGRPGSTKTRERVLVASLVALVVVALLAAALAARASSGAPGARRLVVLGGCGHGLRVPRLLRGRGGPAGRDGDQRRRRLAHQRRPAGAARRSSGRHRAASVATELRGAADVVIVVGANDFDASLAGDPGCADLDCWADTRAMLAATLDQVLTRISALVPARAPVVLTGYGNVLPRRRGGSSARPAYVANSDALTQQRQQRAGFDGGSPLRPVRRRLRNTAGRPAGSRRPAGIRR